MNNDLPISRRRFLAVAAAVSAGATFRAGYAGPMPNVNLGERPHQAPDVKVLNPFGRVPVSFVIDDSACLVNMGHYCTPQFQEAWGNRSSRPKKPWRSWPREIPDLFVREFGEFCREQGVKGKYSLVPYPACVGWLDRELPGWSRTELRASLKLVRDFMTPNWDIHPEMITHTRDMDIQTGRPLPQRKDGGYWMENGGWDNGRSLDEIASYLAYALQLIKNLYLPCEGFTTPGGFGNGVKSILSQAAIQAIRSVLGAEIPHYFKYVVTNLNQSTQPQIEHAKGSELTIQDIIPQVAGVYPRVMTEGEVDSGAWSCGMVAGLIRDIPTCQELIDRIMSEAPDRLCSGGRLILELSPMIAHSFWRK